MTSPSEKRRAAEKYPTTIYSVLRFPLLSKTKKICENILFGFAKENDFSGERQGKFVKNYPKKFFAFFTDFVDNSVEKVENSLENSFFSS